jgi:RNA polymerase sigma factor (sigma-70 family)
MELTDDQLVTRWNEGRDAEAFNQIARRYSGLVYAASKRILRDAHEAEDIAQECFVQLATGRVRTRRSLGAWLHRVATNLALNRLRERTRTHKRETEYAARRGDQTQPTWDDVSPLIDEAINALPDRLRVPLLFHFFQGMTHEAISDQLGIDRSTVSYRIRDGVEGVRNYLRKKRIELNATLLVPMLTEQLVHIDCPASLVQSLSKLAVAGDEIFRKAPHANESESWPLTKWMALTIVVFLLGMAIVALATQRASKSDSLAEASLASANSSVRDAQRLPMAPPVHAASADVVRAESTEIAESAPPSKSLAEPAFTLSGTITDSEGTPLSQADILVWPEFGSSFPPAKGVARSFSDERGNYSISMPALPMKAMITAKAHGFKASTVEGYLYERLRVKDHLELNFTLVRGTVLVGMLLHPNGSAAVDATVYVQHVNTRAKGSFHGIWSQTNVDGVFDMSFESQGDVDLQVCTLDGLNGVFLDVPVGNDDVVTLTIPRPASIQGTITHSSDAAIGSFVRCYPVLWSNKLPDGSDNTLYGFPIVVPVNEVGSYSADTLPSGFAYQISVASASGAGIRASTGPPKITPMLGPGAIETVNFNTSKVAHLFGKVRSEQSGRAHDAIVLFTSQNDPEFRALGVCNLEGEYELYLDREGTYTAEVQGPFYFRDIVLPERFKHTIEVRFGENKFDFSGPEMFCIPVTVVNGNGSPVPGAELRLCRLAPGSESPTMTMYVAGNSGHAEIYSLPGPEVWLEAGVPGFNSARTEIIVGEAGQVAPEVTLTLRRPGSIVGRLVDTSGAPLPKTHYNLFVQDVNLNDPAKWSSDTDYNGHFEVRKALRADKTQIKIVAWHHEIQREVLVLDHEGSADEGLDLGTIVVGDDNAARAPRLR